MFYAGLLPERTADPGRAFHLWSSDGAVILTTNRTDATGMLTGAQEVFGPRLFVCQTPPTVAGGAIPGPPTGCGPAVQGGMGNVGLFIAALDIYLFLIGAALNRAAGNLSDCLQNVRIIADQAQVIGPCVKRLNQTGADLLGAMLLLIEGAEGVAAKLVPSSVAPATSVPATPTSSPAAQTSGAAASPDALRVGGGLLDAPVGVGYLDV